MRQDCLIKIWWILLWRIQNSSCNSEAIWGYLRLIWPKMSQIRPFTYKYHTKIASCLLRLLRGHFLIDLISLQNQGFQTLGSGLSTTLRVVELFLVQNVGLGRANFHIKEIWLQIQRYLVMVGFCVRQSKIHQILIRQSWRILWSSEL